MAYASTPHIEAFFDEVSTATPYKIDWVNSVAGVMIAAGWDVELVQESNDDGDPYYRTVAPTIFEIDQAGEFDSFALFASPPGSSCDGLSVWSVNAITASCLNLGIDDGAVPDGTSEVRNCCMCCVGGDCGDCTAGVHWGSGCGFGCSGTPCTAECATWSWSAGDQSGQHSTIVAQIVEAAAPCLHYDTEILYTDTYTSGTTTHLRSYVAAWCKGGPADPVIGPTEFITPNVGAAFNTSVTIKHGGWVLSNQPSNTDDNFFTMYLGVDRFNEGPGDVVSAAYPFAWGFSTYTSQTHPWLYIGTQTVLGVETGPLSGLAMRHLFRNDTNRMRLIANPYHAFMYSFRGAGIGTSTGTGSLNNLGVGALRTVPMNGEDPNSPATWDFTKAVFHIGDSDVLVGLYLRNFTAGGVSQWYETINDGTTNTRTTSSDDEQLCVAGFGIWDRTRTNQPRVQWVSGEYAYSEPWAGFNSGTGTKAPILGQLWDCIVPSQFGGDGYFFWDSEWWVHWQHLRTESGSNGGPTSNLSWRVGFQTLSGDGPNILTGEWTWPVDPKDVFLYSLQQSSVLSPFPWGDMSGVTLSTSVFTGGTTTATITATCTQNSDAPDDGDKLVAIWSPRNYFTFTPEVITIASGATTGTSVITAVSPGLGTATTTIFANSIDQASAVVTVED